MKLKLWIWFLIALVLLSALPFLIMALYAVPFVAFGVIALILFGITFALRSGII